MTDDRRDLQLDSTVEAPARARAMIVEHATACGCARRTIEDVALAVSEAVTNAVVHGGAHGGTVHVESVCHAGALTVTVTDEGDGLRPRSDSPGLGLGLPIIASVAERFGLSSDDHRGARLRMTFRAGRSPGDHAQDAG